MVRKTLLHAGCGGMPLPSWLDCEETRLDINPENAPDIVADMAHLPDIGPFDLVYTCHALEHLPPHDVASALEGFHRVLRPGGSLIVIVPDIEDAKPTDDVLYESDAGPVAGLDLIYGMRRLQKDFPYMAHLCGFTGLILRSAILAAGFQNVHTKRLMHYALLGTGTK